MRGDQDSSELQHFLEAENKLLREENKEFKELNQLNRDALKIALWPDSKENQLPQLVRLLFEQNSKLLAKCKTLREKLEEKSCQVLISEQIASASNEHEKYVASELKERLKILKKEIQSKDKKIDELGKILSKGTTGYWQNIDTTQTIVVEYTQITKVSEKLFKESQFLRREIDLKIQQVDKLKEQKQELVKLNLILTKQVNEMKAFSCQTTSSMKRDINTSSSDLTKFLKYQSKIAENSDDQSQGPIDSQSQEEDSDLESEGAYEEQVEEVPIEKNKNKFDLSLNIKKQEEKNDKPSQVVPKLELKKARQIQSLIIKKINNDEKKKAGNQAKDQKSKKYQMQLEELRMKLGNEAMLKLRVEKENAFLKKFIAELESRNSLLVKDRQEKFLEKDYEKERLMYQQQNLETLLDICRDVTLNQRLKAVCKGKERLHKKETYSKEI